MSSASLRSQTVHIRALARSLQSRPHYRTATTSSKETQSPPPPPPRRAVTVTTDTGRIPWSELSYRERGARTTQQAVNFGVLVLAMTMTAGVVYVMYTEVFSTESKTAVFNRCADRVRKDARCIELLAGPGKHSDDIVAHHHREAGSRTWRRLVDIASHTETDRIGTTTMHMHFFLTGPRATGTVQVKMTKRKDESYFQYHSLAVDVPGHDRIWLENADQGKWDKRNQGKMFGVKWW